MINEMPTKSGNMLKQRQQKLERAEADKAVRRNRILEETLHGDQPSDPWHAWSGTATASGSFSKGSGKAGKSKKPAETNQSQQNSSGSTEVQQIRRDLDALTERVGKQDQKIDQMQFQMQSNHSEIMTAFRSLGAGPSSGKSSKPASRKRSPEMSSTPLRALADADDNRRKV